MPFLSSQSNGLAGSTTTGAAAGAAAVVRRGFFAWSLMCVAALVVSSLSSRCIIGTTSTGVGTAVKSAPFLFVGAFRVARVGGGPRTAAAVDFGFAQQQRRGRRPCSSSSCSGGSIGGDVDVGRRWKHRGAFGTAATTMKMVATIRSGAVSAASSSSAAPRNGKFDGKLEITLSEAAELYGSDDEDVLFVDGTWWLPDGSRPATGREEYERGPRIKGAAYFDIDDVASRGPVLNPKNLPHMMPPGALFAGVMKRMMNASGNRHRIVLYGQRGCPYIHRSWFQLYAMGHDVSKLHIMTSSLQDWIDAGLPADHEPIRWAKADDIIPPEGEDENEKTGDDEETRRWLSNARNVVDFDEIKNIVRHHGNDEDAVSDTVILDARSPERFNGTGKEPRPGLRLGHMPMSKNIFFMDVLDPGNPLKLKSTDEIRGILKEKGLVVAAVKEGGEGDAEAAAVYDRIVTTCGSGATACTLAAALHKSGYYDLSANEGSGGGKSNEKLAVYDGSWCEYGADPDVVVLSESTN